jgi:hypothetical protein
MVLISHAAFLDSDTSSKATKSEISHSLLVTPAAIAGDVRRSDES